MMTEHPDDEILNAFLSGEEITERVHVSGCSICAARLDHLRAARTLARQSFSEPPPGVLDAAVAAATGAFVGDRLKPERRSPLMAHGGTILSGVALIMLFAVVFTTQFGQNASMKFSNVGSAIGGGNYYPPDPEPGPAPDPGITTSGDNALDSSGGPDWVIVILALGVLVCVISAVIFVVVSRRRRRRP